jgi:hypothetical protein
MILLQTPLNISHPSSCKAIEYPEAVHAAQNALRHRFSPPGVLWNGEYPLPYPLLCLEWLGCVDHLPSPLSSMASAASFSDYQFASFNTFPLF